jgi:hypothetical protein
VEDLQSESRLLRTVLFVFSGVGVFIAGFAAYRCRFLALSSF